MVAGEDRAHLGREAGMGYSRRRKRTQDAVRLRVSLSMRKEEQFIMNLEPSDGNQT
jgi:hypothetical protein